jgi:hypothetical protein
MFEAAENGLGRCYQATQTILSGTILSKFNKKILRNYPSWQTVQINEKEHTYDENIIYINHHCSPNTILDTVRGLWVAIKEIQLGEEMFFFYPSTEWDMNRGDDYPFECQCKSKDCIGVVAGAKYLSLERLSKYFLNPHISAQKSLSLHDESSLLNKLLTD